MEYYHNQEEEKQKKRRQMNGRMQMMFDQTCSRRVGFLHKRQYSEFKEWTHKRVSSPKAPKILHPSSWRPQSIKY